MADRERELLRAPTAGDGVDVAGAHTAALDLDLHVVVTERLRVEFVLVELCPGVRRLNLETLVLIEFRHFCDNI